MSASACSEPRSGVPAGSWRRRDTPGSPPLGRVDPHGGSPAPMRGVGSSTTDPRDPSRRRGRSERLWWQGVRGRTARWGSPRASRARRRRPGWRPKSSRLARVRQRGRRTAGGLDHGSQLGLVGWVLGDVRGGDQQPAAAGPGPLCAGAAGPSRTLRSSLRNGADRPVLGEHSATPTAALCCFGFRCPRRQCARGGCSPFPSLTASSSGPAAPAS